VRVEVAGAPANQVKQRLEQVPGVASVEARDSKDTLAAFEVHSLENYSVRPELARAIVQSGWNLTELRTVGESLEEIFLELTKSETPAPSKDKEEEAVAQ
jgi:ABC-2 type transport system ATP-binding protein